MSTTFTKSTLALAALTITAVSASQSAACGGGGGYRGGYGGGYSTPSYGYSQPVYQQPTYQQPVYSQPTYSQPAVSQPTFQQPVQQQPIQQQPVQQQFAPQQTIQQQPTQPFAQQPAAQPIAQQPAAPQQPAAASQSALDALMAMSGGAAPAASAPQGQQQGFVGAWTATVNNTNQVRLQLEANGAFSWTANSNGKVSSFQGTYSITDGQLTLNRSTDNQQLAGAMSADATGGFRFKLGNGQDNGLLFVRG
ncbi:hypothetical protein Pla108_23320 [Botrimarina colliarenosi]|uniref:Uncharacterized protein n=1 Tax=Botrimarina colliarenosi TaxID=2528001 RepID=A0A5C6AG61_9BACT|nr:hypothetical protein [Botrimarina colliarenosi]TWT98175.1 hypothetical protein Pla108_23320 [Botrimarina colliarenosi]